MRPQLSLAAALLALAAASCENLHTYVLNGQFYDVAGDCLDEELTIDVIEGEQPTETCEGVRCIRSEETGDFYVTTACAAPAHYTDLTDQEDGPCAAALAAYARGDDALCAAGGGGAGGGDAAGAAP